MLTFFKLFPGQSNIVFWTHTHTQTQTHVYTSKYMCIQCICIVFLVKFSVYNMCIYDERNLKRVDNVWLHASVGSGAYTSRPHNSTCTFFLFFFLSLSTPKIPLRLTYLLESTTDTYYSVYFFTLFDKFRN